MNEEQMIILIEKLIDSGVIDKLPEVSNLQSYIVYIPLILLTVVSFRYFIVNGIVNRVLEYQETRNALLTNILSELKEVKQDGQEEKRQLGDVLRIIGERREDTPKGES